MNPGLFGFKALKLLSDDFPKPDKGEQYNSCFYSPYAPYAWKIVEMNVAECWQSKSNKRIKILNKPFFNNKPFIANAMTIEEIVSNTTNFDVIEYEVEVTSCPHENNRCGFYACYDSWEVMDAPLIITLIEAFGKIIPGTKGFRAEKARLHAVWNFQMYKCKHIKDINKLAAMDITDMIRLVYQSRRYHELIPLGE